MAHFDVLLPVRNAAATLDEALASMARQTFPDFRCLVLDDGSTDESPTIAEAWATRDFRFVAVRRPAEGLVATLNAGLDLVAAPFVARMDADDVALPGRLAAQAHALERDPSLDLVATQVEFTGDVSEGLRAYEAWMNSLVTHEELTRDLFVEAPVAHPSVVMRTEALRAVGGYREFDGPEDYDLWLRGWRAGWRFAKVPRGLMRLRDHGERLTKTDARYSPRAFLYCKVEHLVAAKELAGREVVVWGAGRDGKRAAKALRRAGAELAWLVDIAPTKVGKSMLGVPVRAPDSLAGPDVPFVVAAVGIKGARAEIRSELAALGHTEGVDFVCFG